MRSYLIFFLTMLLVFPLLSSGQVITLNTPQTGEFSSNQSIILAPGFSTSGPFHAYITQGLNIALGSRPSQDQNYVRTRTYRIASNIDLADPTVSQVSEVIQYIDGLGRPLQTVQTKGSPLGNDIVQPIAYDQFGREATSYLPYASGNNGGSYRADALQGGGGLMNFYNPAGTGAGVDQLPGGIPRINTPYAGTNFEPSPLNRVVEQGAPGDPWQLSTSGIGGSGHTVKISYGSNAVSDVVLWSVNLNGGATGNTYYGAGKLYTTTVTDENGNNSIEYKDKTGNIVCKKVQSDGSSYLATYYVYDDFNHLVYVIPPIPANIYPSGFTEVDAVFSNYIYGYHYDGRHRLIEKKIPGKQWEYLVYNILDQVVATQDGNQRGANQWAFTKYDVLGRVVWSGVWTNGGVAVSRPDLQNRINGLTSPLWETRPIGGYPTNVAWPNSDFSGGLVINYYDDYSFPDAQYAAPASASARTKGLLTCTKTYVQGSPAILYTQYYYDDLGRNTIALKQHYLGGTTGLANSGNYDEIINTYNFSNEITSTVRHHYTTANTTMASVIVTTSYTYDHVGRKKQTLESITAGNNPAPAPTLVSQLDYNEVGQLMTKRLHSETGFAPFLQDINYTYNERGWLSGAGNSSNLFSFNLQYNNPDPGIAPQFNGNITKMQYAAPKSGSKVFNFSYDQMNRLTAASSTGNLLNEQLSYDPLGNITALTRTGNSAGALVYNYTDISNDSPGNKLQSVTNNGAPFRSYGYDANGNATSDGVNRSISYNVLNLPQTVRQNNNVIATYLYDGLGNKLRNVGSDGSWDYIDGIVYNNNVIQFIQTEEGRAIPNGNVYHYEYNLKDHLGNARVSFDKDPNSGAAREIQEDEYYSFGLRNPGGYNLASNNRYLYNGKELQTDLSNQYDYGARFYDPVIGRWNVVDPMAESYQQVSPYNYVLNNPLSNTDPDGTSVNTRYVNSLGQTIINTNDGRNDVYEVPDDKLKEFTENAKASSGQNTGQSDSKGWNDYWRSEFKQTISEDVLNKAGFNSLSSENVKSAAIEYLYGSRSYGSFVFQEVKAQWSNPVNAAMGLTAFAHGMIGIVEGTTNGISQSINQGKQGKHMVGHNNYVPGKSILTSNAQSLLNDFHSRNVTSMQGIDGVKTRVNFGKTIGNYVDPQTGVSTPTTNGIVINSKTGVHIVPARPSN
jgi:RHS repeat-associated protein